MNDKCDVVITGAGVVTALGRGVDTTTSQLTSGASAVRNLYGATPVRGARIEDTSIHCDVPRDLESQIKFLSASGRFAVDATREAALQAGLDGGEIAGPRKGLYLAQGDATEWACLDFRPGFVAANPEGRTYEAKTLNQACARRVKPFFLLENLKNNVYSFLATWYELQGANTSVAGFSATSQHLLSLAARSVATGRLDLAVVVGASVGSAPVALHEIDQLELDALEPGDGAGALVIETRAHAERRGARPLATIAGSAASTGPAVGYGPERQTLAAALQGALRDARRARIALVVTPPCATAAARAEADAAVATLEAEAWTPSKHLGYLAAAHESIVVALAAQRASNGVLVLTGGLLGQAGAVVLTSA